jgi:hypothetical protein
MGAAFAIFESPFVKSFRPEASLAPSLAPCPFPLRRFDCNLARLVFLGARQFDRQHALAVVGFDFLRIDAKRQFQRPCELSMQAFAAVIRGIFFRSFGLALAGDGDALADDRNVE